MNKKLPFTPNETDAILYVIISVLLLMSVNQVLSQPLSKVIDRGLAENRWNVSLENKEKPAALSVVLEHESMSQNNCRVGQLKNHEYLGVVACESDAFVLPERRIRQFVYSYSQIAGHL